ncbi:hypothetical protein [Deinococcus cellulosilyticus]|uniref:DUF5666 domain-containing protein n=1 Tax=Deinococcus cellulosilyticus (strain DSM 18568 / NBRC 106333 / KACC 11606 / 5516J-15) TaxID=1223518 RepID=A0A511N889_DEIC1|nr:hypothetical protein [Deinococcus cellulosilyticus]GEM49059.1 hypothetical protein DC3_46940 [Deinococcus cellulosilyticus NBRC 106333 = KACC 11606]
MKKTILIAALLLISSPALAEDTAPKALTAVVAFAALKGQTVTFVDAAGTVIATLNPDGTLNATGDLSTVKQVVVTDAAGKSTTYALSGDLSKPGQVKVMVDGKALPLVAVLNKNSKEDKVKPGKDDDSSDDADDDNGGKDKDHHGNGNSDTNNGKSGEHHGNGNSDTENGKSGEDHGKSGDKGNSGKGK